VHVAAADGKISSEELKFLAQLATKWGLPNEELKAVMTHPEKIKFHPPQDVQDKVKQLRDLVMMMLVDGVINKREAALCVAFANKLGLDPEIVKTIAKEISKSSMKAIPEKRSTAKEIVKSSIKTIPERRSNDVVKLAPLVHHSVGNRWQYRKRSLWVILTFMCIIMAIAMLIYYNLVAFPHQKVIEDADRYAHNAEYNLNRNRMDMLLEESNVVLNRLATIDVWYAWPSSREKAKDFSQKIYALIIKCIDKYITEVQSQLKEGKLFPAKRNIEYVQKLLAELEGQSSYSFNTEDVSHYKMAVLNFIEKINQRLELYKTTVILVSDLLNKGQYKQARQRIDEAVRESESDPTLNDLREIVDKIRYQNFIGAEKSLQQFKEKYQDNIGSANVLTNVKAVINHGKKLNCEKQEKTASSVQQLIFSTRKRIIGFPTIKGKVMVWDYTKKNVEMAYVLLDDVLRATPYDKQITIFGVRKRWDRTIGHYSISGQPAYQENMEIGVVYWPQKQCIGYSIVKGGQPPAVRTVQYVPGRGSSISIKNWIQGNLDK